MIIPPQGRKRVLAELHDTHPGASRMKSLARSYIWWPNMNAEMDQLVKECRVCQETRPSPPTAPLHPWEWPSKPWSRLHLDFAGPYMNHMFLIIVDAHSKWMDVHLMKSITSSQTIEKLSQVFAIHGLPKKVVTDNGTSFTSSEFQDFMATNGIKHIISAPYLMVSLKGQCSLLSKASRRHRERIFKTVYRSSYLNTELPPTQQQVYLLQSY